MSSGTLGTSDTLSTYGSATNLWSRSWSDTDFSNANFKIRVMLDPATSNARTFSIDQLQAKVFYTAPATTTPISISGTVYADEGITPITATETVRIVVATSTPSVYTTTATNGVYQFTNIVAPIGTPISVYISGDPTTRAFTVTKASSSANISGLDLYQNHVIVRHEASSAASITNADLALYDADNDPDIQFTANGGALLVFQNQELYVWPGKTFAPGGAVTIAGNGSSSATDGTIHIAQNATFTSGGAIALAGSWLADSGSKFTAGSNTVTWNATTTGKTISGVLNGTSAFYKTQFQRHWWRMDDNRCDQSFGGQRDGHVYYPQRHRHARRWKRR
jgi:hypothetical protein